MDNPTIHPIIQPPGAVILSEGATLRDYFAAKAMASLIIRGSLLQETAQEFMDSVSVTAYLHADAMLAARGE